MFNRRVQEKVVFVSKKTFFANFTADKNPPAKIVLFLVSALHGSVVV